MFDIGNENILFPDNKVDPLPESRLLFKPR